MSRMRVSARLRQGGSMMTMLFEMLLVLKLCQGYSQDEEGGYMPCKPGIATYVRVTVRMRPSGYCQQGLALRLPLARRYPEQG